jgi:hypothetical protein
MIRQEVRKILIIRVIFPLKKKQEQARVCGQPGSPNDYGTVPAGLNSDLSSKSPEICDLTCNFW